MSEVVLDASAVLAFLRREPGEDVVRPHLRGGRLSTVNYAEVLAKAQEIGIGLEQTPSLIDRLGVVRVPFDEEQAVVTASLRPLTQRCGLSLADRSCLALAMLTALPALTADRKWNQTGINVDVRLIR